jgi:hypothetical protein
MLSNDELFAQLDGHHANVLGSQWQIEVCGIHQDGARRWVQLSVKDLPVGALTVPLAPRDGVQHVLMTVSTWIATGGRHAADVRDVA